jgi:uncharacterized protein
MDGGTHKVNTPKKITVRESVMEYLEANAGAEFKPRELAEALKSTYPDRFEKKEAKQLANEIYRDAPSWLKQHPNLHRSEDTPRTYWWETTSSTSQVSPQLPPSLGKPSPSEQALYPMLAAYLLSKHRPIYPKRIDEKTSANSHGKEGNKWLHPDVVGMEDLTAGWGYEMKNLSANAGARQAKLWSFEVKVDVPRSKVREYFFQAVSNSTWANYGYLVAVSIKADALAELRVLHELHGIGVIRLDPNNPADDTVIEIPARERPEVDWGTCNRIASENKDFLKYLQLISHFYATKSPSVKEWDAPPGLQPNT